MTTLLSENERFAIEFIKGIYNERNTNPLIFIDPKYNLKIKEDILVGLQEKDYIEFQKTDLDSRSEIISITLKDKFFSYFNV